jgi:hypothetical protein
MPILVASWLGEDEGADWKLSPMDAVAVMIFTPLVPNVFPFAR